MYCVVGWAKYKEVKKARELAALADEDNEEPAAGGQGLGPSKGTRARGGNTEGLMGEGEEEGGDEGGEGDDMGSGKKKKSKKEGDLENEGQASGTPGEVGVDDSGWGTIAYWLSPFALGNLELAPTPL